MVTILITLVVILENQMVTGYSMMGFKFRQKVLTKRTKMPNQEDKQFKQAIEMLKSEDSGERFRAIEILAHVNKASAFQLLLQALKDETYSVRLQAATILGNLADKRAIEPLIQALEKDELGYTFNDALIKIGRPALLPLVDNLNKTDNQETRKRIIRILGQLGEMDAYEPLIQTLDNTKDDNIHGSVALALGDLGDNRAVELLIQLLKNKSSVIRVNAAQGLGWLKNKKATEALIEALMDQEQEVRQCAASSLGQIGDERAVKPLLQTLNDNDNYTRMRAAEALGRIGAIEALKPLFQIMLDSNDAACFSAAGGVGKLGNLALEHLLRLFNEDVSEEVYVRLIFALGEGRSLQSVQLLGQVLNDETKPIHIRESALNALAKIGGNQVIIPLLIALNDKQKEIRDNVAKILGLLKNASAIQPLLEALQVENNEQTVDIDYALTQFGEKAVLPLLDIYKQADEKLQRRIAIILGDIGDTDLS